LKSIEPNFDGLHKMLMKSEYKGSEDEHDNPPNPSHLYTLAHLESIILTSREELSAALEALGTVEVQGFIRLVSPKAVRCMNEALLDIIIEKNWDISSIDKRVCLQELPDADSVLLDRCLSVLGRRVGEEDSQYWELSRVSLIRAAAHILFNESAESRVNLKVVMHIFI